MPDLYRRTLDPLLSSLILDGQTGQMVLAEEAAGGVADRVVVGRRVSDRLLGAEGAAERQVLGPLITLL